LESDKSTGNIFISSESTWSISCEEDWLTIEPTSGSNNGVITVSAQQNKDTATRKAVVTFKQANSSSEKTVLVIQKGIKAKLLLNQTYVALDYIQNSTGSFSITSNVPWKATTTANWLVINPDSGENDGTVEVKAIEPNSSGMARNATVSVVGKYLKSKSIRITQKGRPCFVNDETPCTTAGCANVTIPAYSSLVADTCLPDPFKFLNGTRMTSKSDWDCRRNEIAILAQEFEFGYKPCTPYEATTGKFANNVLTVTVSENGRSISFDCNIIYPSTGTPPYPAMIGIGYSFLNNTELLNMGVAIIVFPNNDIAQQDNTSSRGKGKFYEYFCENHSAGALMAWAWGISRLIDAIEKTPQANIDPTRLGVTGCSRNGKGALVAGAFDERIVLTIPQESGSGGAASWRVSDYQLKKGQNVQTLAQIVTENVWFRQSFSQFGSTATKLPFDHHSIMALCAPRALLVIENTAMEWLGNLSTWVTGNVAHYVWQALGVPERMGYSQYSHSDHCGFPNDQIPELKAYVKKFLVGDGTDDTNIMKTDGNLKYDSIKWVNWTVPLLN